jgi:NAD(P)-dependent dehydrogenase (short-subunit alcohol dehydrogenase family)
MRIDLDRRHALVTGGGSGIGRASAEAFRAAGARVTVADRDGAGATVAAAMGADFALLDVGDEKTVEALALRLESEGRTPDILVTCAGVLQRTLPPEELTWKEWDRVTRIHQRGTFACCRSFGGRMGRGGAVVTISSVAGLRSGPLHAYGPAKAAIAHLTRCLAAEWGPRGVRVNAVAPGFTLTPAVERGLADGTLDAATMARHAALGRLIDPAEIAAAVVFLASPAASAITGAVLPVDAGYMVAADWGVYGGLRS